MDEIIKFRHTGITVSDMNKSLKFYRDLLGFKEIARQEEKGSYFESLIGLKNSTALSVKLACADGRAVELIEFHSESIKPEKSSYNKIGTTHQCYLVNDIKSLYTRLVKNGVVFISPPLDSADDPAITHFCYDPDGTLVQFVEITDASKIREGLKP